MNEVSSEEIRSFYISQTATRYYRAFISGNKLSNANQSLIMAHIKLFLLYIFSAKLLIILFRKIIKICAKIMELFCIPKESSALSSLNLHKSFLHEFEICQLLRLPMYSMLLS